LKIHLFYIALVVLLSFSVKAQIVFLNNPSNHIVAFNPAFSAIRSDLNHNYIPKQVCISGRVSQSQSDVMASGQHFFERKNMGVSSHYNYVYQDKRVFQKAGLGLSYQLIFFNELSTGWGIGIDYNSQPLQTDTNTVFSIYNETISPSLQRSTYASINFGGLINYEKIMAGFSFQPKELVYFTSDKKGMYYTTGSAYIKYSRPVTRALNAIFWYHANWNTFRNLQFIKTPVTQRNIQSHDLHIHLAGKKGLVGGVGCRITDFNYVSAIAKVGYNFKHVQFIYGIEPYWLHSSYSEIINELSITFKFN
jgi:hypothetical protein